MGSFGGADVALAQSSDELTTMVEARGVNGSSEEIAAALRARGISEEELRQRLESGAVDASDATATEEYADPAELVDAPQDRILEAPDLVSEEFVTAEADAETGDELLPFGYSLFSSSPDSYRQPASGPVDPDYPLGPGDQIVLDVWGDTVFRLERSLDREGGANFPDVGRVVLVGKTLKEARATLKRRFAEVYSGISRGTTNLSVTLGELRVIRAFVVGRVNRPGGYDLSAASTVFHALFFAGGPTESGSLRDIRVVRGGQEVARLDVYEYLRTGKRSGDIRLEDDDTIFVPPVGARVAVAGEIRQPGVYELLPGETVENIIDTTGGFTERADLGRLQVERFLSAEERERTGNDRRIFDLAWSTERPTPLKEGNTLTVSPVGDRLRNYVELAGEVRQPGQYEWTPGATVESLIAEAGGLLETAVTARAELVRTYEDGRREQQGINLAEVLAGTSAVSLQPRDEIKVHSIWDLQDRHEVTIHGAVRSPGTYELREGMAIQALLLQAGGLLPEAWNQHVEVSRVSGGGEGDPETAEIMQVPLGADYLGGNSDGFTLHPWDHVFVREIPNYELQRNVHLGGEVYFPGTYTLKHPRETLSEVIARAGGLKPTAYPDGFLLNREKDGIGRVALNLKTAIKKADSRDNVILCAGDSLFVPEEPKTVTIRGAVGWPTSLVYRDGMSIGDYVAQAGGPTKEADRGETRIIYTTGAAARVKKLWFDPQVRPGATIVVPKKPEKQPTNWGSLLRDSAAVLASVATVALVVDRVQE